VKMMSSGKTMGASPSALTLLSTVGGFKLVAVNSMWLAAFTFGR
jgi:hypothetical protein